MTHNPEHQPDEPVTPETGAQPAGAAELDMLKAALAEAQDKMMRALAEAENTRRRAVKEREDASKFAVSGFARDMLDFADNFARALAAIPDEAKTDTKIAGVMQGIGAMERELAKVFERHGIQKIEPLDQPFDAHFHEVMFEAPLPGKAAGTIIQIVEPGYLLNGRLLRAAKVGVAKGEDGVPRDTSHVDQEA